ncbi:MAG: Cthe_2314 family HEPN domain-containing protein [Tepidanaerobacteraceae bacterium]
MIYVEYRIDNTFELLSQEEWDKYLDSYLFKNMYIDPDSFSVAEDFMSKIVFDNHIKNYIRQHNNKVGTLNVSYALCRHYFDKGIPDDPWFISPGEHGESIQYMPKFKPKDWLVRYWFSYFSEAVYFKLFSIWDSVVGLLNEFYQMGHEEDLRFRSEVMKTLKSQRNDIYQYMIDILNEPLYKEANMYRTRIIHGTTPNDVSSGLRIKRNVDTEVYDFDNDGKITKKKVKASLQITDSVGEYTNTRTIMDNIEKFSIFSGEKISKIIDMIKTDTFHIKY